MYDMCTTETLGCTTETLGLSIARVKQVKCFMLHKVL